MTDGNSENEMKFFESVMAWFEEQAALGRSGLTVRDYWIETGKHTAEELDAADRRRRETKCPRDRVFLDAWDAVEREDHTVRIYDLLPEMVERMRDRPEWAGKDLLSEAKKIAAEYGVVEVGE